MTILLHIAQLGWDDAVLAGGGLIAVALLSYSFSLGPRRWRSEPDAAQPSDRQSQDPAS